MRLSDIILLLFILVTFAIRGRTHWKKAALRVMVGAMIGDITGAVLIAIFYHWHPSIIGWAGSLMSVGAVIGGFYDILNPTAAPETQPENKPAK